MEFNERINNIIEEKNLWASLGIAASLLGSTPTASDTYSKSATSFSKTPAEYVQYSTKQNDPKDTKNIKTGEGRKYLEMQLKEYEGSTNYNKVKKIHKTGKANDPTIGFGTSLNSKEKINWFVKMCKQLDIPYKQVLQGKYNLSKQEIDGIFKLEIDRTIQTLERIIPNVYSFPNDVQYALFDLLYRGDLTPRISAAVKHGDAVKAINLINSTAANDIKNLGGVRKRLADNTNIMLKNKDTIKACASL